MTRRGPRNRTAVAVAAVVAVVTLAYSVLIAGAVFLWLLGMGVLAFLYLVWRGVRALERIADASATQPPDGTA